MFDHHASRGPEKVSQCVGRKQLAVETTEGRIALEKQHPRVTESRRSRLHLAFPARQFHLVRRGVVLNLSSRLEPILTCWNWWLVSDSMPAAKGG